MTRSNTVSDVIKINSKEKTPEKQIFLARRKSPSKLSEATLRNQKKKSPEPRRKDIIDDSILRENPQIRSVAQQSKRHSLRLILDSLKRAPKSTSTSSTDKEEIIIGTNPTEQNGTTSTIRSPKANRKVPSVKSPTLRRQQQQQQQNKKVADSLQSRIKMYEELEAKKSKARKDATAKLNNTKLIPKVQLQPQRKLYRSNSVLYSS